MALKSGRMGRLVRPRPKFLDSWESNHLSKAALKRSLNFLIFITTNGTLILAHCVKKSLKLYVNVIWILAALDLFFLFCFLEGYKCTLKYLLLPMMATGSDYQKTIQRLGLLPKKTTFSYKYFIKICLGFTEY